MGPFSGKPQWLYFVERESESRTPWPTSQLYNSTTKRKEVRQKNGPSRPPFVDSEVYRRKDISFVSVYFTGIPTLRHEVQVPR